MRSGTALALCKYKLKTVFKIYVLSYYPVQNILTIIRVSQQNLTLLIYNVIHGTEIFNDL
jgi:hypothetical protein